MNGPVDTGFGYLELRIVFYSSYLQFLNHALFGVFGSKCAQPVAQKDCFSDEQILSVHTPKVQELGAEGT